MNKFLTLFVFALFAGQAYAGNLRSNNGDLSPQHRRLSQAGQLKLKIDGRGYFMYRLRVKTTDATADASQATAGTTNEYHQGYMADGNAADCIDPTGTDNGCDSHDNKADCEAATNTAGTATCQFNPTGSPVSNSAASAGEKDGAAGASTTASNNVEEAADGDTDNFSQVVYSRDGSLHVNKYGYLCDDNGLLLVSTGKSLDVNAKFHIHIPSRAESILVTPSGKLLAEELGGSVFTDVGQLKLARFENPQGLNVRLHMKSNCAAANEDGFALGNWCAGTELDGKDHVYMSETAVSGPGIVGKPGDQGLGRIVQ